MKGFYNSIRLKKEVLGFFYKNTRFIFMSLSLVLGVLAGTLAFKSGFFSDGSLYSNLFSSFVSSRTKLSAFGIFLNSFAGNLIFLLVSFCCGLFLFGKPLSFAVPFFKGVGLGCICSSAYSVHPDHFTRSICLFLRASLLLSECGTIFLRAVQPLLFRRVGGL